MTRRLKKFQQKKPAKQNPADKNPTNRNPEASAGVYQGTTQGTRPKSTKKIQLD
jgi:hypothetical protein